MRTNGPNQPADLLLDIVELLDALRVSYAVVGALAASFHGVPQGTRGADVLIWLERSGLSDLTDHLKRAGYKVTVRRGEPDDPVSGVVVVEDAHENRVDLLAGVRGMDPDAVQRRVSTTLTT